MCALLATTLSGCGADSLTVDAPAPATSEEAACQALADDLPATIAGRARRDVEVAQDGSVVAAWGDPAVVLSCGGDLPDSFVLGSTCVKGNGVDWYVPDDELFERDDVPLTMTTVGYSPLVRVYVPAATRQQVWAAAMSKLAEPVKAHLESVGPCKPENGGESAS